jgi:hypothetical protein
VMIVCKRTVSLLSIIFLVLLIGCSKEKEEEVAVHSNVKLFITPEEFHSLFKKNADEAQYPEGKFQLMDGTVVNADFFSYSHSSIFEYATAIFYEGELASLFVETTVGIKQIESTLGMKFEGIAMVEPTLNGYQITFHSMFHDSNIAVYPFEWE